LPFNGLPTTSLRTLRISGALTLPRDSEFPSLRSLTVVDANGSTLERIGPASVFHCEQLRSFAFVERHKLASELRDDHLRQLVAPGLLTRVVLLQCSKLSSHALAQCLSMLPALRYVALSLVIVTELKNDFVRVLPSDVHVFKLQLVCGRWAPRFLEEQRVLLGSVHRCLLLRKNTPAVVWIGIHDTEVGPDNGQMVLWKRLALERGIDLRLCLWDTNEIV
jgi:hypothetical protein